MKKIFAIISLAALMMPVSCMKDEMFGPDVNGPASKGVSFTAVMEGSDTKTTLNETTGAVAWAVGDAVKFDYEIQKVDSEPVVSLSLKADDINNGTATFKVEIPDVFSMTSAEYNATLEEGIEPSRHLYVVYPASVVTEYVNSGYTVTIPAVQDGKFESASISLAKWDISKPKNPLDFRNLCGLIQVKVADENVRQIKVSSSDYIAGRANVGFASKVPFDPYIKNMYDDGASKTITVNVDGAGTYYIAVAPSTLKEFYVELFDENKTALGDRLAKSEITVERAHVLPLGTLGTGSFAGEGGFFVKPDGTGDGSSWDNAADYETFRKKLAASVADEVAVVHMAEGNYEVTNVANVSATGKNYKILGGYPKDASGYSLSGRDPLMHPTVLVSDGKSHRVWNFKYGTYYICGISFKDFKYSDGSAINVQLSTNITCKDCVFQGCSGTKNGGAVHFAGLTSTGSVFENCIFSGNSTDGTAADGGFGGAVGCFGTAGATPGIVTFKKCQFEGNKAKYSGGAAASRITSLHFTDCNFIDNIATSEDDSRRASIIYTDASKVDAKIYCDGCYFANSNSLAATSSKGTMILNYGAAADVCINNSVLSGYWGYGSSYSVTNMSSGTLTVSNSTLLGQAGAIVYNTSTGSVSVINSIVGNASSGMISCKADDGTFTLNNSLCTTTAITATDCAVNINVRTDAAATVKFPTDDTPWVHGAANKMRGDNGTKSATVDDCRGKVYYYDWDGSYPENVTFTPTTMATVNGLIETADPDFYGWLTANGSLNKDIRGEVRTDPTWPGSYQE